MKYFPFSFSWFCRLLASSSATVLLLRLVVENACFLSGQMTSHILIMQSLINSPSVNEQADIVISCATIKLALTAASL